MNDRRVRALALTVLVVALSIGASGDIVARSSGAADADAAVKQVPAMPPYFIGNAEGGGVRQWPSLMNANDTSAVHVPRAEGRYGYRFRVTPDQVDASVGGDMAYLDHLQDRAWEREGANTWYRFRYAFPSGKRASLPGSFKPNQTSSGWNMVLEWHEPACCPASPYIGVRFAGRGALMLRWVGGPEEASKWILAYDNRPLLYDHWYDMLVHVRWSADPNVGFVEWWADGRKVFPPANGRDAYGRRLPARFPTLWSVDGVSRIPWLEWGHYRGKADWVDTTYGDEFRIGPTRASVRAYVPPKPAR